MSNLFRIFVLVALPVLLWTATGGCATSAGHGSETSIAEVGVRAERGGFSTSEIPEANHLYALKCARCHKFYDPAKYTDDEWQTWMRKMSRKSKLQPAEEDLLSRFLGAARKGG